MRNEDTIERDVDWAGFLDEDFVSFGLIDKNNTHDLAVRSSPLTEERVVVSQVEHDGTEVDLEGTNMIVRALFLAYERLTDLVLFNCVLAI